MRNLLDPYSRIQYYYIYFSNKDYTLCENIEYGCSIAELHRILSIPLSVIRRDIASLFSMPESGSLFFDSDSGLLNELPKDAICKKIVSGAMDDITISSGLPFHFSESYDSEIPFTIRPGDSDYISRYTKWIKTESKNSDRNYSIKQSYRFRDSMALSDKLQLLNKAINQHNAIIMRYSSPKGKSDAKNLEIYPVRLLYDSTDNVYAVVACSFNFTHLYTYRLDRIVYISIGNMKWHPEDPKYELLLRKLELAPYIWDRNFDHVQLTHVKVCFRNAGNVWKKVKKDLAYRINGKIYVGKEKILDNIESVLIYEDEVSGMNSFRHWLASYGSSAMIIEPDFLKDAVIASLRKQLLNYTDYLT